MMVTNYTSVLPSCVCNLKQRCPHGLGAITSSAFDHMAATIHFCGVGSTPASGRAEDLSHQDNGC